MKHLEKHKKRMLKRKIINTAFLLIFSVIAVATYYTSNFSKAKDIIEVNVNIKNSEIQENIEKLTVDATSGSDGESFYIKLPEYINNKKVIKYSYYLEPSKTTQENDETEELEENNTTEETIEEDIQTTENEQNVEKDVNEIGPDDVLPENKIYLTTSEIEKKN